MVRKLSPHERERLLRPAKGEGGWQAFRRKIQTQVEGDTVLLQPIDFSTAQRYSVGRGGHQDFCRLVVEIATRPY